MARSFDVPEHYRSPLISALKRARREADQRKKDLTPTIVDFGSVRFKIARHFGFCYGVENAIEIAYRAVRENPGKRVFLLSEMIHNSRVNLDLKQQGVGFLQTAEGEELYPIQSLSANDIVIIPAFGTTVELFDRLTAQGVRPLRYNGTCPFVEKVWKRARELGDRGYTVVVHGKHSHEETRATFSHAALSAPALVILNIEEAERLAQYIRGERDFQAFDEDFRGRYTQGFHPETHLARIGVVNQTTMLASETQRITSTLREAMRARYGDAELDTHFADTRDTLCYATEENQQAVYALLRERGDLALVVGGYNSSNTSHLAELCEAELPTYYICDSGELLSKNEIRHYDQHRRVVTVSQEWLPPRAPLEVLLTAGASCPDAVVDEVVRRVAELCGAADLPPRALLAILPDESTNSS